MMSPVSSRPSPSSSSSSRSSDLGSSIRSRVSEGLSRSQAGGSKAPGGLSSQSAGSAAAAEHQRIRDSVMSRISDGFDRPSTPSMSKPPMNGSAPTEMGSSTPTQKPYDVPGTKGSGDTSSVPKSGDPMLDQWDGTIAKEAEKWGVPPENLKALIALESGGDPNATQINPTHGNTYGLAQINQSIWGETARQRGYDLNTPEGQIGFAASLLRDHYNQTGDWDQAHSMYFNPSGTGDSVNGTSNAQYIAKIHEFINSWT